MTIVALRLSSIAGFILLLSGCTYLVGYEVGLRAEPAIGRAPLTVDFLVVITGGLDSNPTLHCRPAQWDFGDGQVATRMGMCQRWRPGLDIQRRFEFTHTYSEPGVYQASFSYASLASRPILVRVVG
jgi:hypothetical protein